jgi:hypothetical protein
MSKNFLNDVVKVKIIKKEEVLDKTLLNDMKNVTDLNNYSESNENDNFNTRRKSNYPAIWGLAFVSLIFLFFAISYLFVGAKITINPEVKETEINLDLKAIKDSNESLSFDLIILSGEESKEISGVSEEDSFSKAIGKVIIYNAFSFSPQKLLIDTRLEGSNNKIYKTEKEVTVPGLKDDLPGSVEVNIYASEEGEEYDSEPLDFKIFGFKGSPKYEKFYARSVGEISGGLKGKHYKLSAEEKALVRKELEDKLKQKLYQKVNDQIPEGFILYQNAVFLDIEEESIIPVENKEDLVSFILKGTLYGFLFNENKLTEEIVKLTLTKEADPNVFIPDIRNLNFSLNTESVTDFKEIKEINFNLSSAIKIVWKFDAEEFIPKILGKSKKDFNLILSEEYPNVLSADLVIKPTWKKSFPDKEKDIKIIINYPQ